MNRKDFIKSLIAGATIAPTLFSTVKAKPVTEIPINPDIAPLSYQCSSIETVPDYVTYTPSYRLGESERILTGRKSYISGIPEKYFEELYKHLENREPLTFLFGKSTLITGWIDYVGFNGESVDLHITWAKP